MPFVVFPKVGDQPKSPFFKKLPPEIRQMYYTGLFGSRLVHVLFHSSKYLKPESSYTREGAPPRRKIPGWAHCVCREGIKALPHRHSEKHHEWCYLSTSIIFTCKYAFEEGIPILYGSNALSYNRPSDFFDFTKLAGRYLDLITKLNLSFYLRLVDGSPTIMGAYADLGLLLSWLTQHEASCLDCRIDMAPEGVILFKALENKVLTDCPQIRLVLPESSREFAEQKLRGGVENKKVEIHWQSDDS